MTRDEIREYVEFASDASDMHSVEMGLHALALHNTVDDLAMLIKRLVQAGRSPDMRGFGLIALSAMDFLARHNLAGECLRKETEKQATLSARPHAAAEEQSAEGKEGV